MGELSLGQAIALGTQAQVKTQNPFTALNDAVKYKNQIDFQKEQQKAKQEAEKQRKMEALMSRIKPVDGKTTVWNAAGMQKDAAEYVYNSIEAAKNNDVTGNFKASQNYETKASKRQAVDANINEFGAGVKSGKIHGDKVYQFVSQGDRKGLAEHLKANPQDSKIVNYNPQTDEISFNHIPKMNLNKEYETAIKDNIDNMSQYEETRKLGNNAILYKRSLDKNTLHALATTMTHVEGNVDNVQLAYPEKFGEYFTKIKQEAPELNDDQIATAAAIKINEENLGDKNAHYTEHTNSNPRQGGVDLNLDYGNQNAGQSKMVIKRQITVNGQPQSREFKLPSAPQYGFKTVTVLNTNGDDYRNLDGGKTLKGQSVQESQVGVATPVAYATKKLVDKNTHDILEIGDVIDEKRLQTAIDNDAVEWQASFPVIGKALDKRGKTKDFSAVVPASKLASAVLLSQSKDDAPGTKDQIQKAINDANAKNEEIKTKHKGSATHPLPAGKPRTVKQNGVVYTWNDSTGAYE